MAVTASASRSRTSSTSTTRLLLNAVRGIVESSKEIIHSDYNNTIRNKNGKQQQPLVCFALKRRHIHPMAGVTPSEFHAQLCQKIRDAQTRVILASLYIGPASSSSPADKNETKESQLLEALRYHSSSSTTAAAASSPNCADKTKKKVEITILLDHNRALRPVPLDSETTSTTTSAEACLTRGLVDKVYLFSVLPDSLQRILPNPWNEIAGVFHIKAYIIDQELYLTGANLSEEYFSDRIDRYVCIRNHEGLVNWHVNLVNLLCQYASTAKVFSSDSSTLKNDMQIEPPEKRCKQEFMAAISRLLTTEEGLDDLNKETKDENADDEDPVVAFAVPTFQAPPHYYHSLHSFFTYDCWKRRLLGQQARPPLQFPRTDSQVMNDLLSAASTAVALENTDTTTTTTLQARIATAYLNPTRDFLQSLAATNTCFLTAGRLSHGFRPKKNATGNKSKDWTIPFIFEHAAADLKLAQLYNVQYYQRPGWTFHAKGLWLSTSSSSSSSEASSSSSPFTRSDARSSQHQLLAVTHGSGNFGHRSVRRDMESNLILILPPPTNSLSSSDLATKYMDEWDHLCAHSSSSSHPEATSQDSGTVMIPPWNIRVILKAAFPWIRTFF